MTRTGLQDVELGWRGQPSGGLPQNTLSGSCDSRHPAPCSGEHVLSLGRAHSPHSSRGPSQKQLHLSPHHGDSYRKGPSGAQTSQSCGQWAAAGWTQGQKQRRREHQSWHPEPPKRDPPFAGIRRAAAPSMAFSFFICRTNKSAQWCPKGCILWVYGMGNCFHFMDFHKMMKNSKAGFLDGWELRPVTMQKPSLHFQVWDPFCRTL